MPAMRPYVLAEHWPGPGVQSDDELLQYCREVGSTIYHPSSTCRMGIDDRAVVDARLRVHGIDGLRVVDGSIMPTRRLRQHQRRDRHDRREGRGHDPGGRAMSLFDLSGQGGDRHRRQRRHRARHGAGPGGGRRRGRRRRPQRGEERAAARAGAARRRRRLSCRSTSRSASRAGRWCGETVDALRPARHPRQQCRHQHPQAAAGALRSREWHTGHRHQPHQRLPLLAGRLSRR